MALLDIFRNFGEKMGKGMERNIGGLLGIDPEDMTEAEKKQARRLSQMAVFDALARGTTPTAGLQGAATLLGAQREERALKGRQKAAEDEIGRITGRLFGGAPAAPADMGEDEAGLGTVAIQSQYRQNPQEALARMYGTSAGRDVAQMAPGLLKIAEEQTAPDEYVYQNVPNIGLVAVNRKDPSDFKIVQKEGARATGPTERFKILTPAEVIANNLTPGVIYQQNTVTKQITPMAGASTGLSDTDVRQYNKEKVDLKKARGNITGFMSDLKDVPAYKSLGGEGRGRLNSSYTLALSAIRQLQNTGVLNLGELPFLQKALDNPTSVWSIVGSPLKRAELDGQIATVLRQLEQHEQIVDEQYRLMGGKIPEASQGGASNTAGGRRGRKPPSAEAVSRAESYY